MTEIELCENACKCRMTVTKLLLFNCSVEILKLFPFLISVSYVAELCICTRRSGRTKNVKSIQQIRNILSVLIIMNNKKMTSDPSKFNVWL